MLADTEENKMYVQALKQLEKNGRVAEHTKIAETPQEKQFKYDVDMVINRSSVRFRYEPGQYEKIFKDNV
jgi:hypothetical protein